MKATIADALNRKHIEFKRTAIRRLLSRCTEDQVDMFNRMYKSVDHIKPNQLDWAISQVERTLRKNGRI